MTEFLHPPDGTSFRTEIREWLEAHVTDEFRGLEFRGEPDAVWLDAMHRWNRVLADAGYGAISWPTEYGGRDLGVIEQVVFAEECSRARAPGTLNPIGLANIAPSIMQFGTAAQKDRFLGPMLRGDEIWCQGFSEPGAGSDLAALSCSAVGSPDGGWVVNGQKVWNTYGHLASWCELLVRTDPTVSKHAGITALLVDMSLPGIEVRPLRTLTGDIEFHEIFFNDVHVPGNALLGAVNQGWSVAMATLSFERGGIAALHLDVRRRIRELLDEARLSGAAQAPLVRQRLARLHTSGELLRFLSDRAISRAAADLAPGPESSLIKVAWSAVGQEIPIAAMAVLGAGSLSSHWGRSMLASRSLSIAGGTTEVNRTIVGERVLGLPKEPRPSR